MPSRPARRRWFQSCMVRPIRLCPSARSRAATVEESTPPDMATAMVFVFDAIPDSKFSAISNWHLALRQTGFAKCQVLRANSLLSVRRRQLPEPGNRFRYQGKCKVDLFRRSLLAQAEAETGARLVGPKAHREQDVRGLDGSRGACCSGGNCQSF